VREALAISPAFRSEQLAGLEAHMLDATDPSPPA
jgi:hypothetical protein